MIQNTNSIMKDNFQKMNIQPVQYYKTNSYPYLFNGIHDQTIPFGYETSVPKKLFITNERMDEQKRIPLRNEI